MANDKKQFLGRTSGSGVWFLAGIVAFIALVTVLFLAGFRIGPGIITRAGTISVTDLPAGAALYIDEQKRVDPEDGIAEAVVLPGNHRVIIGTPDYQPWNELVAVEPGKETRLAPIFVPVKPHAGIMLPAGQADAWRRVNASVLPGSATPLPLSGGCALVSVQGNRILATPTTTPSCEPPLYLCIDGSCAPTVVLEGAESIRSLFPYPGRDDALIVALGTSLFVLELDPREPQFFAPLMRGDAPLRAAPGDEGDIVVAEGARFLKVYLDLPIDE